MPIDADNARDIVAGLRLNVNKVFYHSSVCNTSSSPKNSFHVHPALPSMCMQEVEFDDSIVALLGNEWANLQQTKHHLFDIPHSLANNHGSIQLCSTQPENMQSYLTFFLAARMDIVEAISPSLSTLIPISKFSQPGKKARIAPLPNIQSVTPVSIPNPSRRLFIQQFYMFRIKLNGNGNHNYPIELTPLQGKVLDNTSFSFIFVLGQAIICDFTMYKLNLTPLSIKTGSAVMFSSKLLEEGASLSIRVLEQNNRDEALTYLLFGHVSLLQSMASSPYTVVTSTEELRN